jgi:RNA polymerase sigma-70 factor (ECF subfamily)
MMGDSSAQPPELASQSRRQSRFQARIAAARSGSDSAIAEILESCRHYLLQAANRSISPAVQGKVGGSDLVQETMLQARLRFDRFRGLSQQELLAWTGKILEHKLAHERRRYQGTQKRATAREISLGSGDPTQALELAVAGDDATPSAVAIANEEAEKLNKLIQRLSPDHRQVILLRNWERLSFAEIGERMGRGADAAHKLWARAVLQLRRELSQGGK